MKFESQFFFPVNYKIEVNLMAREQIELKKFQIKEKSKVKPIKK